MEAQNISSFLLTPKDPAFVHFSTHDIEEKALSDDFAAQAINRALILLKKSYNLTKSQLRKCIDRENINADSVCEPLQIQCDPTATTYYRLDGQCNNVQNPHWGARLTPMIRVFDDGFIDGIETLAPERTDESARFDALSANDAKGRNDGRAIEIHSDMSTSIGQIITHEAMKTKKVQLHSDKRKGGFNCCNKKNDSTLASLIAKNPNCMRINTKSNDPCFGNSENCLNYIRSFRSFDNCQLNKSSLHINFHNAVADFELIYNSRSISHLEKNGGRFNIENFAQMEDILVGYDDRSMQLPGLLIFLHTFLKFHNMVFDEFRKFRPTTSANVLSFEARKVATAVFQNIYLEFFVTVLCLYHS